jgi:nucleoid-associated protein YgaU
VLLDVGPRIDATSEIRPAAVAPKESSPPIARRAAPASRTPKADPGVALAGYQAEAPAASKKAAGRRHDVRPGETFEAIAQSYYGSPRFARALWWANSGAIAWPGALAAGKQIAIPAVDELDPKMLGAQQAAMDPASLPTLERVAGQPPGDRRAAPARPAARTAPRVDPQVQPARAPKPRDVVDADAGAGTAIHVVRPNETLRSIARAWFGDDSRAREIAELNRELLQAEGRPRVGQRLILPAGATPPAGK